MCSAIRLRPKTYSGSSVLRWRPDRIQHTLHGSLYILDRLVDDAVQTHVDFLAVRDGLRLCVRTNVETDDDRIGSGCKCNVGLVDRANAAVDDFDNNFLVGKLYETLFYSLYRTLYIGFYDDRKFLDISGLDLGEQVVLRGCGRR